MENFFQLNFSGDKLKSMSVLGLAHIGDGVYELLCRAYLCDKGDKTVLKLHKDTVDLVKAPAQAKFIDLLLPHLTEEEFGFYRRGKNAHTHATPKSATKQEYAKATGLEALFGALYLQGKTDRINELFHIITDSME
jgi:ribonuclease-3 family protein